MSSLNKIPRELLQFIIAGMLVGTLVVGVSLYMVIDSSINNKELNPYIIVAAAVLGSAVMIPFAYRARKCRTRG